MDARRDKFGDPMPSVLVRPNMGITILTIIGALVGVLLCLSVAARFFPAFTEEEVTSLLLPLWLLAI